MICSIGFLRSFALGNEVEAKAVIVRKTGLLRQVLELTQQEVLLVDLDGLASLLEEKERLIDALRQIDEQLVGVQAEEIDSAERQEQARLLAIVLENEAVVAERVDTERRQLRGELRELEQSTRIRKYLERPAARRAKVDLKR
jgi:hypothetical protein